MVSNIFLGIGSNKGSKESLISQALERIGADAEIELVKSSSIYETKPYGVKNQDNFLNLVIEIKSNYQPGELFKRLKKLEKELGRKVSKRWGPREIDIDILFYDDVLLDDDNLTIPHKDLINRDFVLVPMNEIAPNFIHPVLGKKISELLSDVVEKTIIRKINNQTD